MSKQILSVFVLIFFSNIVKLGFISPEEIIVYPNSCVNITLSDQICDQILKVSIIFYEGLFNRHIWILDYPREEFNYYYSRYLNNIGANWVSLCDLDHNIANNELQFKVIKKKIIKKIVSSKIKIAHCGYVSGCKNVVFPHNNDILNHVTQISDFNQDIKLKLNFPNMEFISLLSFSLCPGIKGCLDYSLSSIKKMSSIFLGGISFFLDIPSQLVTLKVTGYDLSEFTFHILYKEKNVNSLLTTIFNYTSKMLEPKMFPYSVQYNIKSVAKMTRYNIFVADSTNIGFTRFVFKDQNELKMISFSNIKCEINKISWIWLENITYNIIFIDFEIDYNGEIFRETHHLIIDDYPIEFIQKNTTIQVTSPDALYFKKFNSYTINIILFLIAGTILLIVELLLILYKTNILFRGKENFKGIFVYKEKK